ncbi:NAD(P)-dependent oxidoreductase [Ferrovibrio sp.]|uniref:NAD(P)-dependent oxidoreductase n=1 Tax=Ferrovibrio sp. TaxID=1917215 RepID=UPI0035ADD9EE
MSTDQNNNGTLGFIGLGVMGGAMCRNLIRKSGRRVLFHDRRVEAMVDTGTVGGKPAATIADVIRQSDIVLLSLPDGPALRQVVTEILPELRNGQIIIDTTTASVELTRSLAQEVHDRGADYLDAPVARTRQAAESGTLSIMVGGEAAVLEQVQDILKHMASDITHCGPVGAGQIFKILNNMVLFQTVNALSEALAIARAAGVDGALLFEVFTKGSADSFALRNHGMKALLPGEFPERAFSVTYARKDNAYALDLAKLVGVDATAAGLIDRIFSRAQEHGLGDNYFPVIHRLHTTD